MQTVAASLADGSTTQVLVPQVYLRRTGDDMDLRADGALISARNIELKSSSDIVNDNATLLAAGTLKLQSAGSVSNLGGRLAAMDMEVSADRDILLQSTTQTTQADFAAGSISHTAVDRIATVRGGTVSLQAARDILAAALAPYLSLSYAL